MQTFQCKTHFVSRSSLNQIETVFPFQQSYEIEYCIVYVSFSFTRVDGADEPVSAKENFFYKNNKLSMDANENTPTDEKIKADEQSSPIDDSFDSWYAAYTTVCESGKMSKVLPH